MKTQTNLDKELREAIQEFDHCKLKECTGCDERIKILKIIMLKKMRKWIPEKKDVSDVYGTSPEGFNDCIFEITANMERELCEK